LTPLLSAWGRGQERAETVTCYAPVTLEAGDLLLLVSRAVGARLSRRHLRHCLLALLDVWPRLSTERLAQTLIDLATREGRSSAPVAVLVVRCETLLTSEAAQAQGWPAAFSTTLPRASVAGRNLP